MKDPSIPPLQYKIYPLDQTELAELKKKTLDLLKENKIWVSSSLYGASIFFAKKKDRQLRLCVDNYALHENTISDSYPLPRIKELLSRLKGAQYFSYLGFRDGYFHVPIAKVDVHKTAFYFRYGIFGYFVMPFGLINAPSIF